MALQDVLYDVAKERARQDEKWGSQRSLDEVAEAILNARNHRFLSIPSAALALLREELVQVAAVVVATIEDLDSRTAGG